MKNLYRWQKIIIFIVVYWYALSVTFLHFIVNEKVNIYLLLADYFINIGVYSYLLFLIFKIINKIFRKKLIKLK